MCASCRSGDSDSLGLGIQAIFWVAEFRIHTKHGDDKIWETVAVKTKKSLISVLDHITKTTMMRV